MSGIERQRSTRAVSVLVVEDDPELRDLAAELLEDLGYRTRVATDGDVALAILEAESAAETGAESGIGQALSLQPSRADRGVAHRRAGSIVASMHGACDNLDLGNLDLGNLDLGGHPAGHRIVVAMSGGVDSSVVAALLVERGYDVVGITLQLYDHGTALGRKGACCAGQDIHDAARVAERLGIAHYVLDYEDRFRREVIEDFARSYRRGETPVPCIRCNQRIKFRDLLATARDLGASALATGHYVRRLFGAAGPELHRARDGSRDQSYFLFATTPAELDFLRFPLGALSKVETRALARHFGLAIADKPDSQDICFVPQGSYAALVEQLEPEAGEPGEIVDRGGRVLGHHNGIARFTVGQRRGLGIAAAEPLYVLAIEPEQHRVMVGPGKALAIDRVSLGELNWLLPDPPNPRGVAVAAKLRSAQAPLPATLFPGALSGTAELVFATAVPGAAPGQAAVLYDGDRVLGGGWIRRAPPDAGATA